MSSNFDVFTNIAGENAGDTGYRESELRKKQMCDLSHDLGSTSVNSGRPDFVRRDKAGVDAAPSWIHR